MKAIELLRRIQHLIEVAEVDPNQEIFITDERFDTYPENTPVVKKVDWMWLDPVDEGNTTKILQIILSDKETKEEGE